MPNGTGLDRFQPHHPDKYFDVGIAEEHAVLFAAGLAAKGFKPFCAIYSTFLQRAFDPIVHDVCLQNLPVVFCMDRGGLSADDGPTHHGAVRHQLSARHSQHRPHGSQGRGRTGRHAVHRDAMERAHRGALSARRGTRHAGERRSQAHSHRQGRTAAARRERPRGDLRAGRPGAHGRRDRPQTGRPGLAGGGDQCPLHQADRRGDAGVLRAQRGCDPHPGRSRAARRLRQRRAGGVERSRDRDSGGADRLARSVHRARQDRAVAGALRDHRGSGAGKTGALLEGRQDAGRGRAETCNAARDLADSPRADRVEPFRRPHRPHRYSIDRRRPAPGRGLAPLC